MSKQMIRVWREGDEMRCTHDIANINADPRAPIMLASVRTMAGTVKKKIRDDLFVIYNSTIMAMAQAEAKNPALTALHYQDEVKDIVVVSNDTLVTVGH